MSAARSRYDLLAKLASGGMGTVYVGRVRGAMGFSRLVAIKRAHPHLAEDPTFSQMLMDEAKLASLISHPHVVSVLDVERVREGEGPTERRELRLVMDYVEGATVHDLLKLAKDRGRELPPGVVVRIVLDAAAGLQAAHELADDGGHALGIVHRDVSPQNILVGIDGMARVSDFGIAKVTASPHDTTSGSLKGKLGYMAPEYVESCALDARSDVFSLGIVAWEALASRRLFKGESEVETLQLVAAANVPPLSSVRPEVGPVLDDVLATVLTRKPEDRFASARAFANALESEARSAGLVASHAEVAELVRALTKEVLEPRRAMIRARAKELDASAPTIGTVDGGGLRRAIDSAQVVMARQGVASVPDAPAVTPAVEGTLDGTGTTGNTHPRPRSRRAHVWLLAFGGGVALAGLAFGITRLGQRDAPSAAPAAADPPGSIRVTAEAAAPSQLPAALAAPALPPLPPSGSAAASAAEPSASASALKPAAVPARSPPPRQTSDGGLPPNPYGR